MTEDLRAMAARYTDEALVRAAHDERSDYTEEALRVFEEELARRNIDPEELQRLKGDEEAPVEYKREDFVSLDHKFSQTDLLIAVAMLKEHEMPFLVESAVTSDILPTENIGDRVFTVQVHGDHLEEVRKLVDEHFSGVEGMYARKELGPRDRLKALSFFDIGLEEPQMHDSVEVQFSSSETRMIGAMVARLVGEVDKIEKEQDRTVFYYDSLDDLAGKLNSAGEQTWTVGELFTILEVFQIYCDDPAFPQELEATVSGLVDFVGAIGGK